MSLTSLFKILLLLVLVLPNYACSSDTTKAEKPMTIAEYKKQGWIIGKVVYNQFEGGFYGIITESGDKLLPLNLAKEFKLENNKLAIKGKLEKTMVTIQQWGTPFVVAEVKLLEKGNGGANNIM